MKLRTELWNSIEKMLEYIVVRILHLQFTEEARSSILQFVKFGIVGATNTAVSYIVNILTIWVLSKRAVPWDYVAGNIMAFVVGTAWSYIWNNRFVFTVRAGENRNPFLTLFKTYISYAFTGIVLNNILSYFWISVLGISKYIAPLINLLISVPVNFLINKYWTFKTAKEVQ